ncbi:MAG: Na+-driven multidrug efflux pump [Paracoccaceae bacterium]|jgi:Na+-driven multidrug efflux pump
MSATEQNARMVSGGIVKEFARFVVPSVFGLLAISSASVIDGIFIGNFVGATALASVSLVMPLLALVFGVLLMITLGGTVGAGKNLGEGNPREASNMFSKTGISVTVVLVAMALIVLVMPEKIAFALGARGATIAMSAQYAWVIAWFFPGFGAAVLFSQFARIDGRPGISFLGLLSITLANVALDFIMVAWLGWGLFGAALATGIAYGVGAIIPLIHFLGPRSNLKLIRPYGSWFVMIRAAINGFSEFLNEASSGLVVLLFNWVLMSQIGAMGVAAFAVVDYVVYFGILIFYGVSEGIVPLISVNFGARKPDRIFKTLLLGIGFNTAIGAALIALLLLWPDKLIGFFLIGDELEIRALAVEIMSIVWPLFVFTGANIAISAYFTGMHCAKQSSAIALMRALVLPVGLIYLFQHWFGFMGTFYALPVSEALTFILSIVLLLWRRPQQIIDATPVSHGQNSD